MKNTNNKFSLFLVWMRNHLGLTGPQIAAAIGCHTFHLSRYEAGRKPGKAFYQRILNFVKEKPELKKRLDKIGPVELSKEGQIKIPAGRGDRDHYIERD